MAGLPPDTIHVKRKRGTEDSPVDFLRLERSKRYRSLSGDVAWVYQRKTTSVKPAEHAPEPPASEIPTIQPTQEGDEARLLRGSHKGAKSSAPTDAAAPRTASASPSPPATAATVATEEKTVLKHPATEHIRRFHLSRSSSPQPAAGVSKKRTAPAVFVERSAKKQRESLQAILQERSAAPTQRSQPADDSSQPAKPSPSKTEEPPSHASRPAAPQASPVKYKRPGTKARTTTSSKPTLPPSLRDRDSGTNMDELARIMDSWTLAEINKTLDRIDDKQQQQQQRRPSLAKSRFRPKAPKQRYFERHPEHSKNAATTPPAKPPAASDDGGGATDEEGDYIIETYERVPASRLQDQPAHRVGLLVFDTEPDMVEFFYGNESDSEDEFPEDEEDENAENYYTTEYPDEDLDWDDELDRDAYLYRNQNASDLEEFDERDFVDEIWERSDNPFDGLAG